jgi:hypothetical protein
MTGSWLACRVCMAFIEAWVWSGSYLWLLKGLLLGVRLISFPPDGHQKVGSRKQPRSVGSDDRN